jgi:hypothetical protein
MAIAPVKLTSQAADPLKELKDRFFVRPDCNFDSREWFKEGNVSR